MDDVDSQVVVEPEFESKLTNDHWVSKAYQANFADAEKRVAIVNLSTCRRLPKTRAIRSNFRERGFTSYLEDGRRNQELEDAFASLESTVLDRIRKVSAANAGPEWKVEVAHLFAIHLVRSPAYAAFHDKIACDVRSRGVPKIAAEPRLAELFEGEVGRPPDDGELLNLTHQQFDKMGAHPSTVLGSMARHHDLMAEKLNQFHMQVVEVDRSLPGFALGDTPIVHGDPATTRYGFRDRLALLDASFIFGPLSRYVGVCFASRSQRAVSVRTRKQLDRLNGLTVRAALSEVACHPDDARAIGQVCHRLDRFDPSFLFGG